MTCFFYIPQEHLPKGGTARSDLGSSILIANQENTTHACLQVNMSVYIFH